MGKPSLLLCSKLKFSEGGGSITCHTHVHVFMIGSFLSTQLIVREFLVLQGLLFGRVHVRSQVVSSLQGGDPCAFDHHAHGCG